MTTLVPPAGPEPAPEGPPRRWPRGLDRMGYGGDYSPEQWPREVWDDDIALMREAGVSMVTVAVFAWALLEPDEGRYDLEWLADVVDRLHAAGILVDLATPTAAPPAWFAAAYPGSLPVTRDGRRLGAGAREHFCPSSPHYRAAAVGIATAMGQRFGDHPAVALWHVNNEYGAHVGPCYCPTSEVAFRDWLRARYRDLDALNDAWGTTFWGQRYGDWDQVPAPREAPMPVNPAHQLDFMRFSSEAYLECYLLERDELRSLSPGVPVTTNFMTTNCKHLDYWRWADEVDVLANDHYLTAEDPDNHVELALSADITRGLARGRPWLLMEHSTGAVNWQPRNLAKEPGQMRRNSLAHLARGADGVLFFQWRTSRFGAEKFHSAMVPQAGTDSRLWRDVVALGADLAALTPVLGSTVQTDVALVWDWEAWWALELEFRPSTDLAYLERVRAFHGALWDRGHTVDVVRPGADLFGHRVVVVPSLYLMDEAASAALTDFVRSGGHLVVSFFSGIVDRTETVPPGPYPGLLRDLLGITVEELHPLPRDASLHVGPYRADLWSETVHPSGAETLALFADGPDAGLPALTRHRLGRGSAWYAATRLERAGLSDLLGQVCDEAGCRPVVAAPRDVEVVRRRGESGSFLVALNHGDRDVTLAAAGTDLLTGTRHRRETTVPGGGAVVLAENSPPVREDRP